MALPNTYKPTGHCGGTPLCRNHTASSASPPSAAATSHTGQGMRGVATLPWDTKRPSAQWRACFSVARHAAWMRLVRWFVLLQSTP